MSKRKPDVYLQDILESIIQIEEYLDNTNENEFYRNPENKMPCCEDWKSLEKP